MYVVCKAAYASLAPAYAVLDFQSNQKHHVFAWSRFWMMFSNCNEQGVSYIGLAIPI